VAALPNVNKTQGNIKFLKQPRKRYNAKYSKLVSFGIRSSHARLGCGACAVEYCFGSLRLSFSCSGPAGK